MVKMVKINTNMEQNLKRFPFEFKKLLFYSRYGKYTTKKNNGEKIGEHDFTARGDFEEVWEIVRNLEQVCKRGLHDEFISDDETFTASGLHHAIRYSIMLKSKATNLIKVFVDRCKDLSVEHPVDGTLLRYAAEKRQIDVLRLLISNKSAGDQKEKDAALQIADERIRSAIDWSVAGLVILSSVVTSCLVAMVFSGEFLANHSSKDIQDNPAMAAIAVFSGIVAILALTGIGIMANELVKATRDSRKLDDLKCTNKQPSGNLESVESKEKGKPTKKII